MSDLFGSDVSDSETPAPVISQPSTPQPAASEIKTTRTNNNVRSEQQRNGSVTPEPARYSDNEDDLFGSNDEQDKEPADTKAQDATSGGDALDDLFDSDDEEEDIGHQRRGLARRRD
ncbi:hypothetical protein LPJ64_005146, partial [Coemansia asiatica]